MTTTAETAPAGTLDAAGLVAELRASFDRGTPRPEAWRRGQLRRLNDLMVAEEARIFEALKADLGRCATEAYVFEVGYCRSEVRHTLKHLSAWMRPERVSTPLHTAKATSRIHRQPLGVVLIIGPWNYPFQLAIAPLIAAIAAGNCAVVKPSELAPATSKLMGELLPRYLDSDCIRIVEGGVPETTALLEQKYDHVFFTGSTRVGKIVYQAAAKHLTPVTLELGGKSPCIVDRTVDLPVAARRIVWGKFANAGQTCVAPDYILAHEDVREALVAELRKTVQKFYGEDPRKSPDFGRIINAAHFERLTGYLEQGEVTFGGEHDAAERYLAPTLMQGTAPDAPVMQDEIFGPILPVLPVGSLDEAITFVNARPKPLALYVFSADRAAARKVIDATTSGGAAVNDTINHLAVPDLPFGGVGDSGIGSYHGPQGFKTFSHTRSVLDRSTKLDLPLRYPPYVNTLKWVRKLLG